MMSLNNLHIKLLSLVALLCVLSCEKTNDNHAPYLIEGEIRYTTKPHEVKSFAGRGRAQLRAFVRNAYSVSEFVVQWNEDNKVNSKSYPFTKGSQEVDSIDLIIDQLSEKSYFFDTFTRDKEGNQSVKVTSFASSFGESYRSNLIPRRIASIVHTGTDGIVSWVESDELERGSEIKFMNTNGEEVMVEVNQGVSEVTLENLAIDSKIQFRSYYVPLPPNEFEQESSIDQFESDWNETSIPPELIGILESIEVKPIVEGINLGWSNLNKLSVEVGIEYKVNEDVRSQKFNSSEESDAYNFVGLENGTQDVTVSIKSVSGAQVAKVISVAPDPITQLNQEDLAIVGLETDEVGLGSFPPSQLIDGNTDTFFHTNISSYDDFPHHLTIDLGEEFGLAKFRMYPRHDCCRDRNVNRFQLWGINDLTGAETKLASKDSGWEDESISLGWTLIVDESPGDDWNGSSDPYTVNISKNDKKYRYIRLRSLSNYSQNQNTAYGEAEFWRFGDATSEEPDDTSN